MSVTFSVKKKKNNLKKNLLIGFKPVCLHGLSIVLRNCHDSYQKNIIDLQSGLTRNVDRLSHSSRSINFQRILARMRPATGISLARLKR